MTSTDIIRAVADYRGTFLQGKLTTLQIKITDLQGTAIDPSSISVNIYSEDNPSLSVSSGVPEKIVTGFFIYDWSINADEDIGPYIVTWTYEIDGTEFTVSQGIIVISDPENSVVPSPYSERIASIRASFDYHLGKIQALVMKGEQGNVCDDNRTVKFNFPRWNQNFQTRIYRNGRTITSGITINYFKGEVIFDEPVHEKYDTINADYNFRWFADEELDRFLSNGIHLWNAFPPHKDRSLFSIEDKYIPAVLYAATIDAIRRIIADLLTQEPKEVFGGPEAADKAIAGWETLKKNYEGTWKLMIEAKAKGPYKGLTRMVSVPEFTLPGGRSRWFRYMMGGFNLS
jgi:hypothetical protein